MKAKFHLRIDLINSHDLVEWRAVEGDPACRGHDRFLTTILENTNMFAENYVLKDGIKDREGCYHDDLIHRIVNKNR